MSEAQCLSEAGGWLIVRAGVRLQIMCLSRGFLEVKSEGQHATQSQFLISWMAGSRVVDVAWTD
jgi:hypothetical protein